MKKLIIGILIVLLVLIAALAIVPFLFKDKIVAKVKTTINDNVNAKVNFGSFDLTLLTSFPNFGVCLNDLTVIGINEFAGDTLTSMKELDVKLDLMSAIKGEVLQIKSITLEHALVNLIVHKDGKANWDISKPSPTPSASASSNYKIALNKYALNHSEISYDDQSGGFKLLMQDINHTGSGDFTQDLFTLSTKTHADKTSAWYGGVKYLTDVNTDLTADLEMDMKNSKYTFRENELVLNDLAVGFDGYISMPKKDIVVDMKFKSKKTAFASIVSLIPGAYKSDFKNLKSSGTLDFNGFVKGVYNDKSIPGYAFNLNIQNGKFQYPSLPTPVNNVQVDLKINNPDGVTDHTIIDLKRMHAEFGAEPFDARLYVSTPISDANLDAMVKGKVNLANIKNMVPLEKGTELSGLLVADLTAKGRMSAIEKKQYENFNANGSISVSGMNYKSESYPKGIAINQFVLSFNPKNVTLSNCDVNMGNTDVKATGTLDNFLAYYLKNETLRGSLNLYSNLVDLNELMGTSAATNTSADTARMKVIEIPSNIDFTINASVTKLLYEDLTVQNLKGNITMRDQVLSMNGVTFNTLDGLIRMSGAYATKDVKSPDINFDLNISDVDIQKTFKTFLTVQKMAPIAERCNGKVSSTLTVSGKLDQHMQPLMNTLNGEGSLKTGNVTVSNFEPISKMADALKMPQYKQLSPGNVSLSFHFKDGRVNVEPFDVNLAGTKAKVEGSNGFDQTLDYKVDLTIPKTQLGTQAAGVVNNLLAGANKTAGTNLAVPDPVNVKVYIGGTVTNPQIKTGLTDAAVNLAETVKEQVKATVEEKVDEAKANAKEQADKIIHDAEVKAKQLHDAAVVTSDQVKKEGYAAADKLVAQAKDPISKAAAKTASDKLKKETDAKSAKIIKEADDQGKKLTDEAHKQADALLK